jgi:hypothetical protein
MTPYRSGHLAADLVPLSQVTCFECEVQGNRAVLDCCVHKVGTDEAVV